MTQYERYVRIAIIYRICRTFFMSSTLSCSRIGIRSAYHCAFVLAGLYYGAWFSQRLVRSINKGEYLLQPLSAKDKRDPLRTLTMLHFTYEEWDFAKSPQPQFDGFCHWMKRSLLREHPVMFGIFLPGLEFDDYDHIVPAVGICYENEDGCDNCRDKIIYFDLYNQENVEKCLSKTEFSVDRESIHQKRISSDGCLPLNVSILIRLAGLQSKF